MSRVEAILIERSSHQAEIDRLQKELAKIQTDCGHESSHLVPKRPYEPNLALGCNDVYFAGQGTMLCDKCKLERTCAVCPSCDARLLHDPSAMKLRDLSEFDGWRAGNSVRELNGGECSQCGRMYVWLGREIEW